VIVYDILALLACLWLCSTGMCYAHGSLPFQPRTAGSLRWKRALLWLKPTSHSQAVALGLSAGKVIGAVAKACGGGGGGKPALAQVVGWSGGQGWFWSGWTLAGGGRQDTTHLKGLSYSRLTSRSSSANSAMLQHPLAT
jgi:hypothetical protein